MMLRVLEIVQTIGEAMGWDRLAGVEKRGETVEMRPVVARRR